MSVNTVLATIGADLRKDIAWVEGKTEAALEFIWGVAKPIFTAAEPTVIQDVLDEAVAFLSKAADEVKNGGLDDIEQAFLEHLETLAPELLTVAQGLGSNLLQVLIGLAKGAAAKL